MGFDIRDYIPDQHIRQWLHWIEQNPTSFIYYVILILSPFLGLSAFLSWKLSKDMQKDAKEKKQKEFRTKAILAAKDRTPVSPPSGNSAKFQQSGKGDSQAANGPNQIKHIKKKKK